METDTDFESDPAWGAGVGLAFTNGRWIATPYARPVRHNVKGEIVRRFKEGDRVVRRERDESSIEDTSACGGLTVQRAIDSANVTAGVRAEHCEVNGETWQAISAMVRFAL